MTCEDCKHYKENYCNLMDELVTPVDHCGMCNCEDLIK